jgi:hypothetical protein
MSRTERGTETVQTQGHGHAKRRAWALALSTMVGLGLVVAACSGGEKTVINNTAQCGPGTRIEGTTCVAVSGDATASSSGNGSSGGGSSGNGSTSSSGATSTSSGSGAMPDSGMDAQVWPADCPTEVTDPAKRLLVLNCDPGCGGKHENCTQYKQLFCRKAGVKAWDRFTDMPAMGADAPWDKIVVRLPANPWEVFHACDVQQPLLEASQAALPLFVAQVTFNSNDVNSSFRIHSNVQLAAAGIVARNAWNEGISIDPMRPGIPVSKQCYDSPYPSGSRSADLIYGIYWESPPKNTPPKNSPPVTLIARVDGPTCAEEAP